MDQPHGRAVRFDRYGGTEVYRVEDVPVPTAGPGRVVVEVRAAAINPGETVVRTGAFHERLPATFPSGQGTDFAGVVTEVGEGVNGIAVGDQVLGFSWERSSHATHVAVPADQLVPKPPQVSWEAAGSLDVAGTTAWAAVEAVDPRPGEVVAVSAAAGGVGSLVTQLLVSKGARVLGIASPDNDEWLTAHGATPVHRGEGLHERLVAAAAPRSVDAFIDLFGPEYVHLAVDLGVPRDRIETIIAFAAAQELGTKAAGSADVDGREVLTELVRRIADGTLEVPVAATYPLDRVVDAFTELERRRTRGKIVLVP